MRVGWSGSKRRREEEEEVKKGGCRWEEKGRNVSGSLLYFFFDPSRGGGEETDRELKTTEEIKKTKRRGSRQGEVGSDARRSEGKQNANLQLPQIELPSRPIQGQSRSRTNLQDVRAS